MYFKGRRDQRNSLELVEIWGCIRLSDSESSPYNMYMSQNSEELEYNFSQNKLIPNFYFFTSFNFAAYNC